MLIDLHIHSTASDGTDTPEQILEKISAMDGVKIFALTDHDTIKGVEQIKNKIPQNIFFVNGVEFSCKTASGNKCHILGYFYDATNKDFQDILKQGKNLHAKKLEIRLKFLSDLYKVNFSADDVKKLCENEIVGKPHIVNFISEKFGIAKHKIYSDLRKCEIDARLDAKKVIDAIKNSGGVSVWAHPLGGEGEKCPTQAEFKNNFAELKNLGVEGLEIYYSRYNAEQRKILLEAAEKNDLLVSGGSDYHGKNKNISLFEVGRDKPQIKVWRLTFLQKIFEKHSDARVRKAFEIAKKAHAGQVDKAGTDYIFHPVTVALNFCGDTSAMIVGLLHDVVEDTNFTFEDLQKIPLTVKELVDGIESRKYFLPSIQREFVWGTDRIEKLFDSLMKGFPIGSFLFWEIPVEKSADFTFYEFIRNYHQRNQKHNPIANLKGNVTPFQAILDGQQRTTSLYIGLKGSYAEKLKRYRVDNPNAYLVKKLYVNLLDVPNIEDNDELGLSYYFKFLTPDEATKDRNEKTFWFEVGDILKTEFEDAGGIFDYVIDRDELNKSETKLPAKILSRLQKQIRLEKLINYYLEKNNDDKQGGMLGKNNRRC